MLHNGTSQVWSVESRRALITAILKHDTVSIYYFPTDKEEEVDRPKLKERLLAGCLKCIDILCVWDCCWCWVRVQELVALIVFDPFMELFITLCIVVNTLFMAMDHDNMDPDFENILKSGNYVSLCMPVTS